MFVNMYLYPKFIFKIQMFEQKKKNKIQCSIWFTDDGKI